MEEEHDMLLTAKEATKFIHRSYPTLLKDIKAHRIAAVPYGKQWRIKRSELERFLHEGNSNNAEAE